MSAASGHDVRSTEATRRLPPAGSSASSRQASTGPRPIADNASSTEPTANACHPWPHSHWAVAEAIRFAYASLKLVVEPGGVVGLAALLSGKVDIEGQTACVVLSGGNIDPALFSRILAGEI